MRGVVEKVGIEILKKPLLWELEYYYYYLEYYCTTVATR